MKKLLLLAVCSLLPQLNSATDLRGRVDGIHAYSSAPFPLAGSQVTIFAIQMTPNGPVYNPMVSAVTGSDGMYYFRNIPAGSFVMQVGGVIYPLQVNGQAAQDIQAVLLRF